MMIFSNIADIVDTWHTLGVYVKKFLGSTFRFKNPILKNV